MTALKYKKYERKITWKLQIILKIEENYIKITSKLYENYMKTKIIWKLYENYIKIISKLYEN